MNNAFNFHVRIIVDVNKERLLRYAHLVLYIYSALHYTIFFNRSIKIHYWELLTDEIDNSNISLHWYKDANNIPSGTGSRVGTGKFIKYNLHLQ